MPLIEKYNVKVKFYIQNKDGIDFDMIVLNTEIGNPYCAKNGKYDDKYLDFLKKIDYLFRIGAKELCFYLDNEFNSNVLIFAEKDENGKICLWQKNKNEGNLSRCMSLLNYNYNLIIDYIFETKW